MSASLDYDLNPDDHSCAIPGQISLRMRDRIGYGVGRRRSGGKMKRERSTLKERERERLVVWREG